jgi:hypothetical protein
MPDRRLALLFVSLLLALFGAASSSAASLFVAYVDDATGGVARIDLDVRDIPQAAKPVIVFQSPAFTTAHKLRVAPDGRLAALAAESEDGPNLALIRLDTPAAAPRVLSLGYAPEADPMGSDRNGARLGTRHFLHFGSLFPKSFIYRLI